MAQVKDSITSVACTISSHQRVTPSLWLSQNAVLNSQAPNFYNVCLIDSFDRKDEVPAHVSLCAHRSIHNPSLHMLRLPLEKTKTEEMLDGSAFANVCGVFGWGEFYCIDFRMARPSLYSITPFTLECACACRGEKELFNYAGSVLLLGFLRSFPALHTVLAFLHDTWTLKAPLIEHNWAEYMPSSAKGLQRSACFEKVLLLTNFVQWQVPHNRTIRARNIHVYLAFLRFPNAEIVEPALITQSKCYCAFHLPSWSG